VPGTDKEYLDIIRDALITRYSFIKYYYTSFYNFYLEGGSFFKPLFYEYPQDPKAFVDVEVNILLGDAMKLSMETTTLDFVAYP
jgi:alpha-glucosidase